MSYSQYIPEYPNGTLSGTEFANSTRNNMLVLRDAAIMGGGFFGFSMLPSGGTTEEPQYLTYSKSTERVRATLTWVSGNVTQAVYEYSPNSGTDWDTIGTKTITYNSDSIVTQTAWS